MNNRKNNKDVFNMLLTNNINEYKSKNQKQMLESLYGKIQMYASRHMINSDSGAYTLVKDKKYYEIGYMMVPDKVIYLLEAGMLPASAPINYDNVYKKTMSNKKKN